MRLTVLVDNSVGNTTATRGLKSEAGLSIYIEDQATRILFDTGESSLFLDNARQLGINLFDIQYIVLSHGHHDHSWGLTYLLDRYAQTKDPLRSAPILLAHPQAFCRRFKGTEELGFTTSDEKLARFLTVQKSNSPVWITDRLVFLGEINRQFPFEGIHSIGQIVENNVAEEDFMQDDTALAYKSPDGLIIITGCSHSGICNIAEQAKQICQDNRILAIIGGLHLQNPPLKQINSTIDYLKKENLKGLYACHCTDQPSRIALAQLGNLGEVNVGFTLEFP